MRLVKPALAVTAVIDEFNRRMGIIAIWLVLAASLVSALNAFIRYSTSFLMRMEATYGGGFFGGLVRFYGANSNTLSESQWYMFAGIVMLGGAWTLKVNEHVRVDLVYGWVSERTRTWIDLLGLIFFLLPMCAVLIWFTWPWFYASYVTNEGSLNAGGLIRWPVKLIVLIGFVLMGLQGISELIKCWLALTHGYIREFAYEKPLQ